MKRVIISEDHTMFAMMLKLWLQKDGYAEVVAVATTGSETLELVKLLQPDILLQDMMLSDMSGLDIIKRIRLENRVLPIYAITAVATLAKQALEVGANGCMLKEDSPYVIRHVIDWDINTGIWVSPLLGERFYRATQELLKYSFTTMELNILKNIAHSNNEIAALLNVSEGTVRNTLTTIYQKTNISTRPELIRYVQDVLLLIVSQNV